MASNVLTALSGAFNKSYMAPVDNRGGWWPFIREPYSGAWQNNDSWTVDSVLAYPPVYACVSLISNDIGKLRPTIQVQDSDGIWVEQPGHKLASLLKRPNRFQNHIQFKQWWITSLCVRGNTYVLKERDAKGGVVSLYILEPERVHVLVAPDGSVFYQLSTDHLSGIEDASVTVPASEIIHDRINCLFHPLVGVSPLFSCGTAGSLGLKIQTDSRKFFENGARPSGLLTAPGSIGDETAARLKAHWEANYTGDNAGRTAVLGDGLEFEPMRMTSVDAQLMEQLKWTAEAVCTAFHMPAYKIGVGTMPTHNNIEALTQDYYSQCLQSPIESMELCLAEGLEITGAMRIELDLDGLFRMDTATKIKTLGEMVRGSLGTPNEGRKRLNLKPLPGGDTVYLQEQNYSLEALSRRDAQENPFGTSPSQQGPTPEPLEDDDMDEEDQNKTVFALLLEKELSVELP